MQTDYMIGIVQTKKSKFIFTKKIKRKLTSILSYKHWRKRLCTLSFYFIWKKAHNFRHWWTTQYHGQNQCCHYLLRTVVQLLLCKEIDKKILIFFSTMLFYIHCIHRNFLVFKSFFTFLVRCTCSIVISPYLKPMYHSYFYLVQIFTQDHEKIT